MGSIALQSVSWWCSCSLVGQVELPDFGSPPKAEWTLWNQEDTKGVLPTIPSCPHILSFFWAVRFAFTSVKGSTQSHPSAVFVLVVQFQLQIFGARTVFSSELEFGQDTKVKPLILWGEKCHEIVNKWFYHSCKRWHFQKAQ